MRKIFLLAAFIILTQAVFAQENNDNTTVTVDEAKENSKGILKQLFMFKMAADVLETRALISDNDLGDSIENHMDNYDNALFFISKLEYDFFWNSVLGRKKYKVPSSKMFLDSKDKYLENNVVNTSIDFDIVLTPQWEDPSTEEKLKDYKVKIEPSNFINLSEFDADKKTEFNNLLNSHFSTNVVTPKDAPVNDAVFDGLDYLKGFLKESGVDFSKFSVIMWGDSAIENNSSLYAWNRVPRDLLFLAYDGADLKKVDWTIGDRSESNKKTIEINIDDNFFGEDNKVDITVSKSNDSRSYSIVNLNIDAEGIVDSTLTNLTSIRDEFAKLRDSISTHITENVDTIIIDKNSKYLKEGMSKLFTEPSTSQSNDFDKILVKMYELDAIMLAIEDYNELHAEITEVLKQENFTEFMNVIIAELEFVDPVNSKADIIANYKGQIEIIAMQKMNDRLKSEENE